MRTTKYSRRRNKLLGALGAVGVAVLLTLTGPAPAGADTSSTANCESASASEGAQETPTPKSIWFLRSKNQCGQLDPVLEQHVDNPIVGTRAYRYSRTSGEILWERVPGAINYEIFLEGESLGFHDRLSWQMTDLEQNNSYLLSIRAFDQYGTDMNMTGLFYMPAFLPEEQAEAVDGPDPMGCEDNGSIWILRTNNPCQFGNEVTEIEGTSAYRYSGSTGEILWERVPGAINYEIFLEDESLGFHDRLNWNLIDLEATSSYRLSVRAFDRYGTDMDIVGTFFVRAHTQSYSLGDYF